MASRFAALARRKPARGRKERKPRLTAGQVRADKLHGGRLREILGGLAVAPERLPEAANSDRADLAPAPDLELLVALAWRKRPV